MPPGIFGENLTITDFESSSIKIRDHLEIGSVVLEVTAPRIPCIKLASQIGDPVFPKRFRDARRPGMYCRVMTPGSLSDFALLNGESWVWRPWGELLHSIRTGQTAFEHLFDMGLFDYVRQHADAAALLDKAMTSANEQIPLAVEAAYDFAGVTTLIDVGGGYGELLATILQSHPQMRGVLFDLPETVEGARSRLHAAGVAERCTLLKGNFFQTVPEGGSIYLLKWILHDWDDQLAEQILLNCHRAMLPDTRLLVIESVLSTTLPQDQRQRLGLLDMQMLAVSGGRERHEKEYRHCLPRRDSG